MSFASLKALNVKGQMSQELGERHLEKEIKGQKGNSFTTAPPTHTNLSSRNCCHFVDTVVTMLRLFPVTSNS